MPITELPLLEELLQQHAAALGRDYAAYRNHCYRVVNFCAALSDTGPVALQKMSVAVAFHDLGIWTDASFDYLAPSERLAREWLARNGHEDWAEEVGAMVREHHKIRRWREPQGQLVEAFRKADWIDVSLGLLPFGLPRRRVREIRAAFPNAGFHWRLVQLASRRLLTHPWSPMPMMRW